MSNIEHRISNIEVMIKVETVRQSAQFGLRRYFDIRCSIFDIRYSKGRFYVLLFHRHHEQVIRNIDVDLDQIERDHLLNGHSLNDDIGQVRDH